MSNSVDWHKKFVKPLGVNMWAQEWYSKSITMFDANKIADVLKQSSSTVGLTFQGFTHDHFGASFYPTEIGHRHKNLKPGRDHADEYKKALSDIGAKYIAYYSYSDYYLWQLYPDYRIKNENGEDVVRGNTGIVCPNSPYAEYAIAYVTEIAKKYKPDGWLFDDVNFSGICCYCDYCKRKYRMRFGLDMPRGTPDTSENWRRFIQWRYDCFEEFYSDLVSSVRKITPDAKIFHNALMFWGSNEFHRGVDDENLFKYDDLVTNIFHYDIGSTGGTGRWIDMIWQASFLAHLFRGFSGKPVWIQMGRFMYERDYTIIPERELELAMSSVITGGGFPAVIDNVYPDGTVNPVAAERISHVYGKIDKKEQYLTYDSELCETGIFYSRTSQDWLDLSASGQNRYGMGIIGLCKTLVEEHVPYCFLSEKKFSEKNLEKIKTLFITDCIIMNERTVQVIRNFVERGGVLICAGKTALITEDGRYLKDSMLADVLGVHYREPLNYKTSFLAAGDNEICKFADIRQILPLRDCYPERFHLSDDACLVMYSQLPSTETTIKRQFSFQLSDVMHGERREPFASTHNYGAGKVLYIGGNLFRDYGIYGNPDTKKILKGIINWCPASPVITNAPSFVEAACFINGDMHVLHLLNYATGKLRTTPALGGPAADEAVPIHNIQVAVLIGKDEPHSVITDEGTKLDFKFNDGYVNFTVPILDIHLMVIIK